MEGRGEWSSASKNTQQTEDLSKTYRPGIPNQVEFSGIGSGDTRQGLPGSNEPRPVGVGQQIINEPTGHGIGLSSDKEAGRLGSNIGARTSDRGVGMSSDIGGQQYGQQQNLGQQQGPAAGMGVFSQSEKGLQPAGHSTGDKLGVSDIPQGKTSDTKPDPYKPEFDSSQQQQLRTHGEPWQGQSHFAGDNLSAGDVRSSGTFNNQSGLQQQQQGRQQLGQQQSYGIGGFGSNTQSDLQQSSWGSQQHKAGCSDSSCSNSQCLGQSNDKGEVGNANPASAPSSGFGNASGSK